MVTVSTPPPFPSHTPSRSDPLFLPAINGLIVSIQTQSEYLIKKPSWTRRMVLVTDAETPLQIDDWEATVEKINELAINTTIM